MQPAGEDCSAHVRVAATDVDGRVEPPPPGAQEDGASAEATVPESRRRIDKSNPPPCLRARLVGFILLMMPLQYISLHYIT